MRNGKKINLLIDSEKMNYMPVELRSLVDERAGQCADKIAAIVKQRTIIIMLSIIFLVRNKKSKVRLFNSEEEARK